MQNVLVDKDKWENYVTMSLDFSDCFFGVSVV